MSFPGGVDDSPPGRRDPIARVEEERRLAHSGRLASGSLACARCDAPVAVGNRGLALTNTLTCPFCSHRAPVRDFLSLALPTRPARVLVRVTLKRLSVVRDSPDP